MYGERLVTSDQAREILEVGALVLIGRPDPRRSNRQQRQLKLACDPRVERGSQWSGEESYSAPDRLQRHEQWSFESATVPRQSSIGEP